MKLMKLSDKLVKEDFESVGNDYDPFGADDWEKVERDGARVTFLNQFPPKMYIEYKRGSSNYYFVFKKTDSSDYRLTKIKTLKNDYNFTHIDDVGEDDVDTYIESYAESIETKYGTNPIYSKMVESIIENIKSRKTRNFILNTVENLKKKKYDV